MNNLLKVALLALLAASVAGCGDSDKETEAEYNARARAADVEAADGTIAIIGEEPASTANMPRLGGDMSSHPLSRYFNAYGEEPLKYFGRFWNLCDESHSAYVPANCDKAVERGIRVGRSVGIELTRADLVNPAYWDMLDVVRQMKLKAQADFIGDVPAFERMKKQTEWNNAYREKVTELMAPMDDR